MASRATELEEQERRRLLDRAKARWKLLEREGEYDLRSFIEYASPQYEDPVHMAEVCEALDLSMRKPVICLVEGPPRHYKTETILHHIARRLKYRPTDQVAYAAYGANLARAKSRTTREIASRSGLWLTDERTRTSRFDPTTSVSHWQTHRGGGLIAGGRGGGFTGQGFQLIVMDDPYADRIDAESKATQEKVWELWKGTMWTRREPGGSVFITHQPWNRDDLIARIKRWAKKLGIEIICITMQAVKNAEYDENDQLIAGEALAPHRFSFADHQLNCSVVGYYNWHSQYQATRVRSGRKVFPEFRRYEHPGTHLSAAQIYISCDPGIDKNEKTEAKKPTPDPSGIVVAVGYLNEEGRLCLDILWAIQIWLESIDLLNFLQELQDDHYEGAPVLLEEVSAFKILGQVARRLNPTLDLVPWLPRGSKLIRSHPCAAGARAGLVRVPREGDWLEDGEGKEEEGFLTEARDFTGKPGGRDNRIDALVQLFDYAEDDLGATTTSADTGSGTGMSSESSAWGVTLEDEPGLWADLARR